MAIICTQRTLDSGRVRVGGGNHVSGDESIVYTYYILICDRHLCTPLCGLLRFQLNILPCNINLLSYRRDYQFANVSHCVQH